VVPIIALTLVPSESASTVTTWCVICGERGAADAILNVALYVPLGMALGMTRHRWQRAVAVAVFLSVSVEVLQVVLPGRDASAGDLLFNTVGAIIGLTAVRRRAMNHAHDAGAAVLALALGLASLWIATADAFTLDIPDGPYVLSWTPRTPPGPAPAERVLANGIGRDPLAPNVWTDSVMDRWEDGTPLWATVEVRSAASARSVPLVVVKGRAGDDALVIARSGDDLLAWVRTRSARARLDVPRLRWSGALAGSPGAHRLTVRWSRSRDGSYCVTAGNATRCGLGFTTGDGWRLLHDLPGGPPWLESLAVVGWIAALAVPLGRRAQLRWPTVGAAGVVLYSLMALPLAADVLRPTPADEYGAAALGALLGWIWRRRAPRTLARQ
jgi:hypothetical protein